MSAPDRVDPPATNPRRPRIMAFRSRSTAPLPTPEQSKRQGDVVRSAWRHFGEPGPVIAFLNTRHDSLDGQPLHLAIESEAGLERVRTLLEQLNTQSRTGGLMRKKRDPENDEQRSDRLEKNAHDRIEQASAEDNALDAAVRLNIKLHGA